jgi:hypothetical protein
MSEMHGPGDFGSGNFLPQSFGGMSWWIVEIDIDTSKRLLALAVTEIPFDVRTDERENSASDRILAGKVRTLWMPDGDQIMETRHFWSELSMLFESDGWPLIKRKPNHEGTRNGTMTCRQLTNIRSLSLRHDARLEEVPRRI